jgi:DNA repair protein RecO (recombination protein O)
MLHTTRAVVLRTVKHTDKSTVLKACTELFGTRSFVVRTGQKGMSKSAALQPLCRVEMVVAGSADRDMQSVREIRVERPYMRLQNEPMRGLLALFTQEVLYRTLREESGDAPLFAFVQDVLEEMDTGPDVVGFPLTFLIQLMYPLGIGPEPPTQGETDFDMREGHFFTGPAPHEFCMRPPESALFASLLESKLNTVAGNAPSSARRKLLDDLLVHYRLHVDGFGELRSLPVLQALLA